MNRFIAGLLFITTVGLLHLFCSNTTDIANSGGSSTETIGGILVDTLGVPVSNVLIRVDTIIATDSIISNLYYASTNKDGYYEISNIQSGDYKLSGRNNDSSLVVFKDKISYQNTKLLLDIGIDTMYAPGNISGKVLLNGSAVSGVDIYIHGLSYMSKSDGNGEFLISKIPAGKYLLGYQYSRYMEFTDSSVIVTSGQTTTLDSVNLQIDINDAPPAPVLLNAIYDTATGVAFINWNAVDVSDLLGYTVYRKLSSNIDSNFVKIDSVVLDSFLFDTLFTNLSDTNSYEYQYKITAMDTLENQSSYSSIMKIKSVSPASVKTSVIWTKVPSLTDTITIGDTVALAIQYSNKLRKNIILHWFIGDPEDTVQTRYLSNKSGYDTLYYICKDTGSYAVSVGFVDDRGDCWFDTSMVSVNGVTPSNRWEEIVPMIHARRQEGVAVVGDELFVVGGVEDIYLSLDWNATTLASVEKYSFATSTWNSISTMPTARDEAATVAVGDKIYVIGGRNYNDQEFSTIEIYNTKTDSWEAESQMWDMRFSHAAAVIRDSIYVFGGIRKSSNSYTATDSIYAYDPVSETWTFKGLMTSSRASHQVVVLNDKIYILGGYENPNSPNPVKTVEVFDPSTGSSTLAKDMLYPRMNFGATVVDGKIFVVGGVTKAFPREIIKSVESLDLSKEEWVVRKDLPKARHSFSICKKSEKIYVIGGADENYSDPRHVGQTQVMLKYYP